LIGSTNAGFHSFHQQSLVPFVSCRNIANICATDPGVSGLSENIKVAARGAKVIRQSKWQRQRRQGQQQKFDRTLSEKELIQGASRHEPFHEIQIAIAVDFVEKQSLKLQLEQGSEEAQRRAIDQICKHASRLTFDRDGCWLVQSALDSESADVSHKAGIAAGVKGDVWRAIHSPHANYVLQRLIEVLPPANVRFIADELKGVAVETARHKYGCRVLCRLVEHANCQKSVRLLITEILNHAHDLAVHYFGHIVLRSILVHEGLEQHAVIARTLQGRLGQLAQHKHGSFIVQELLLNADEQTGKVLVSELCQDSVMLTKLAQHQFGHHVAKALVRLPAAKEVVVPGLQCSQEGQRCLKRLGLSSA